MIFAIPGYSHAINEVAVTLQQRPTFSPRGYVQSVKKSIAISGTLQGDTFAALTTAINNLEIAYGRGIIIGNAGLFTDAGLPTAHVLSSAGSLGGIRIVGGPNYPQGDGGEYTTYRNFEIQLEADYPNLQSELVAFEETLTVTGTGGPRFVILETITGPPVKQITNQRTTVRAVQSGSAIGLTRPPDLFVPGPIWPQHEQVDERPILRRGPQTTAGVYSEFGVQWTYKFWSPGPLSGQPNAR